MIYKRWFFRVALYTSAWIEIDINVLEEKEIKVALYTSAWIEMIFGSSTVPKSAVSHSTRVRGLK